MGSPNNDFEIDKNPVNFPQMIDIGFFTENVQFRNILYRETEGQSFYIISSLKLQSTMEVLT